MGVGHSSPPPSAPPAVASDVTRVGGRGAAPGTRRAANWVRPGENAGGRGLRGAVERKAARGRAALRG